MVITPSVSDLAASALRKTFILGMFILAFLAVVGGCLGGYLIGNYSSSVLWTIIPCFLMAIVLLLFLLGEIAWGKIVIDKTTESVVFTKRLLMLIARERVIPFSQVRKIRTEYNVHNRYTRAEYSAYDVSIELPGALRVKTVGKCPQCGYESSSWRVSCLSCGAVMSQI